MKKLLFFTLLCPTILFGQEVSDKTSQNDDVIESFMKLSTQQLFDTANYYFKRNNYDTALIYYNLVINTIPKNADVNEQMKLVNIYDRIANIYFNMSDYRVAYDFLIKRLLICEKFDLDASKKQTYANIGLIYFYLNPFHQNCCNTGS